MTDCPQLTTRDESTPFITKDNLYELIPSTYNRSPGTAVTVRCADGVSIVGETSFSCASNGEWSYKTKPYCTASTPAPTTEDDTTTTVLVGAVCGVAAIIVIVLFIMLIVVYRRDKKYRRSQKSLRTLTTLTGYNREPPAPYDKSFDDDLPPRKLSVIPGKGLRRYEMDLDSQLSNSMYLPRDSNHETQRDYYSRDSDTTYYTGIKRPQVRPWVSRGPQYADSIMAEISDDGQVKRDPLLWRNASVLY